MHLRARWYAPGTGTFLNRDPWEGSSQRPRTYNGYVYTENNPIGLFDPSGFCSQSGWSDTTGIFTKANCDRLESGDLNCTKDWYYSFADYVKSDLPQTSAHFRHFLNGSGSPLQMPSDFVKDIVTNVDGVNYGINELLLWYVRENGEDQEICTPTDVGTDGFAASFTPKYAQAHSTFGSLFGDDELDVAGSLGSFRSDVVLDGTVHRRGRRHVTAELNVHVVILDIYDWHQGLGVSYEGNAIPDKWALSLVNNGTGASFFVRGDYQYKTRVSTNLNWIFSESNDPPNIAFSSLNGSNASGWFRSSCIGRAFDPGLNGSSGIDYCGDPIK